MSKKVILVTGSSSGFGRLTLEAVGACQPTVNTSMRDVAGRNANKAAELPAISGSDICPIELEVQSEPLANAAVDRIIAESGRIDLIIHNAGHMLFCSAEAFTTEQQYEVNVVGMQHVNRAALPHIRAHRECLLVWVFSSSSAGGTPA